jgi:hypothetical protein
VHVTGELERDISMENDRTHEDAHGLFVAAQSTRQPWLNHETINCIQIHEIWRKQMQRLANDWRLEMEQPEQQGQGIEWTK